jgi:hypothetical protein
MDNLKASGPRRPFDELLPARAAEHGWPHAPVGYLNELTREILDPEDADITISHDDVDDEMTGRYPFTYRQMPSGDIEQVEP